MKCNKTKHTKGMENGYHGSQRTYPILLMCEWVREWGKKRKWNNVSISRSSAIFTTGSTPHYIIFTHVVHSLLRAHGHKPIQFARIHISMILLSSFGLLVLFFFSRRLIWKCLVFPQHHFSNNQKRELGANASCLLFYSFSSIQSGFFNHLKMALEQWKEWERDNKLVVCLLCWYVYAFFFVCRFGCSLNQANFLLANVFGWAIFAYIFTCMKIWTLSIDGITCYSRCCCCANLVEVNFCGDSTICIHILHFSSICSRFKVNRHKWDRMQNNLLASK